MFKNKGFLYGLGLGLILGAGLLQLMNFSVMDDKTINNEIQSPSPSISPSVVPTASLAPFSTIKPTKPTETTDIPAAPSSTPTTIPVETPAASKTDEPAVPTTAPAATIVDPSGTSVIIENGMTSSEVSSLLFEKGIIEDKKAFDNALSQLKLDRIIRIGTFTFLPDEKDEDIINKITTRK
ncbi:hypothetical protein EHS13_15910 [Paenibacillus psychroresistens]|uniref:Endolytic transglycosylase MltG n=1 Tax=Paenibacillus psychroresistens TaxID=1778678 RepID=A0A6B8RLL8_9BACL|nr:hypothetical protein [Paenibacillus psychroresistens]QGQ96258.1 hypothetical protein EHS13_15910 [Paenibacillus psychroresistens]